jgi:hypothetical protein
MKRTAARFAPLLATAMAASGCATTHLSGEYRPHAGAELDTTKPDSTEKEVIGEHGKWLFLWGLIDTRDFDTASDFKERVKEGYIVKDIEVKDRESVAGVFLWIITAGLVNHHTIVIKAHPIAPEGTIPAGSPPPATPEH